MGVKIIDLDVAIQAINDLTEELVNIRRENRINALLLAHMLLQMGPWHNRGPKDDRETVIKHWKALDETEMF